ncbi:MAG: glycosyltransferase family 39 protein [Saprospiraceae bacterium]|nr:glycosyltransferase family 39 protein [Candidatus Opimibacter iunctus]
MIYALAGPNPLPFHLFNILAYGITGLILYRIISTIFHKLGSGNALALLITALFLAHPVHTEVVANIKSADEILALLFGLSAMLCLLTAYDTGKRFPLWLSGVFMLLACLSKESAITFLITIPLVLWFFRKASLRWTGFYTIPLVLGAAVFLMLRESALGGLAAGTMMSDPLNNPFLQWDGQVWIPCSMLVKAATILYTFWKYVWLIIIPFPLTHDYYPFHIALQSFSSPGAIGGLTLFVAFLLIGIFSLLKKTIEGYGILFPAHPGPHSKCAFSGRHLYG